MMDRITNALRNRFLPRSKSLAGDAYAPVRDDRELMGSVAAWMWASGIVIAVSYISLYASLGVQPVALVVGCLAGLVVSVAVHWDKRSRHWFHPIMVVGAGLIAWSSFVLSSNLLIAMTLWPMVFVTHFYWRDHRLLVLDLIAISGVGYVLPTVFGPESSAASERALFVTLPIFLVVAVVVGMLADRFRRTREIDRERFKATIEALSAALTARDGYTGSHSEETLELVMAVADELHLDGGDREYIGDVALLHDIGKIGIPNEILHAPGQLDEEQWAVMREHPVIGERIVARLPGLEQVASAIRHEHERWDGGGYPDGLRGEEIPLASRIVLACDAYHAMTSDRPYRKAMDERAAQAELLKHSGTQFDPVVVSALLRGLERLDHEQGAQVYSFAEAADRFSVA